MTPVNFHVMQFKQWFTPGCLANAAMQAHLLSFRDFRVVPANYLLKYYSQYIRLPCWKNYSWNMHVSCVSAQFMHSLQCMFHACTTYNVHACFMFHAWNMHGTCEKLGHFSCMDMLELCMTCMNHACHVNLFMPWMNHAWTMHESCMHEWSVYYIIILACLMQDSCRNHA